MIRNWGEDMIVTVAWLTLACAAYLLIGVMAGRAMFVRVLGDRSRLQRIGDEVYWTGKYIAAFWLTILTLFAWPVVATLVVPFMVTFSSTPNEKYRERTKQLNEKYQERMKQLSKDEQELARLTEQYGLPKIGGMSE